MTQTTDDSPGIDYQRLYEYRFRGIDQQARMAVWDEISAFVWERTGRPRRVLDPAAGRGEFINSVPADERWAVDRVAYAEGTYDDGVRSIVSDVFDAELPEAHFDLVWISNFLEHLPSQEHCGTLLRRLRAATAPGGRIAVMGPNIKYCADDYWDCADHTLGLSHVALEEHLYAAGFEIEESIPRFLPFSFRGRYPASPRVVRRYLRMPLAWRLVGKQFLVVGRA